MGLILFQPIALTQPTGAVPTGAVSFYVTTPTGVPTAPVTLTIAGLTTAPDTLAASPVGYGYLRDAIPPGDYVAQVTDSGTPAQTLAVAFTIVALPTPDAVPVAVVAAHLPVLAVILAAPTGTPPQPAVVLLVVEVQRGTAWVEVGRLRQDCDPVLGTARFDLSEYLKTQFTPTAPTESATPDPALSLVYRARYGQAPGFTGTAGTEAGTFGGLALNAALVPNPGGDPLPLPLGPALPYASVPVGLARFRSTLTATGITAPAAVPEAANDWPCPARQFVWLHPSGAWCWGLFTGRHEHGTETGDEATVRRPEGDYYVGGSDTRATLRVYSDRIDWPTFELLRTIRRARRVYERLASGAYVAVLIERGSFPDYRETDKVFEVNFTVRYPVQAGQTF